MENPFQSPEEPGGQFAPCLPEGLVLHPSKLVGHVRVVAILMMIQGGMELCLAVFLGVFTRIFPQMMAQEMKMQPQGDVPPETVAHMMTAIYGGAAVVIFVVALLHIVAGVQNFRFRGRVLGMVAMSCGVLTVFGCYCFPTALALGIYGLIVYLNEGVAEAFQMGKSGYTGAQITAAFRSITRP
jgi:hypothetical protein